MNTSGYLVCLSDDDKYLDKWRDNQEKKPTEEEVKEFIKEFNKFQREGGFNPEIRRKLNLTDRFDSQLYYMDKCSFDFHFGDEIEE